jgi:hypothetical protein
MVFAKAMNSLGLLLADAPVNLTEYGSSARFAELDSGGQRRELPRDWELPTA